MEIAYPGGREIIRESYRLKNIPEEAHNIFILSLSESSWKQYEIALKKWWTYCCDLGMNYLNPTVHQVISFLTKEFNNGAAYGTLNSYRSALALLAGSSLGQDDDVKRFFKGVANVRPNKPKYEETWDPKLVLDFYRKLPTNENLSLKELSMKLIILLALTTGHRMQTFALIKVNQIREVDNTIEIRIPDKVKTSGVKRQQPILVLPEFKDEIKLCVANTLKYYLIKTKDIRGNEQVLFLSYTKPHKPVGAQTLSKWIKKILFKCNIDITKFSGYSTRHAATSAANRSGLDINIIKKTAGWSDKSKTFARFYNLPIAKDRGLFARNILENN